MTGGFVSKSFAPAVIAALVAGIVSTIAMSPTGGTITFGPQNLATPAKIQNFGSSDLTITGSDISIAGHNQLFLDNDGSIDICGNSVANGCSLNLAGGRTFHEGPWDTRLIDGSVNLPQTVTNASDQDSTWITFPIQTGSPYVLRCELYFTGSNLANDAEFRFAVAAGTITGRGTAVTFNAADTVSTTGISAAAAANTNSTPVGTFSDAGIPVGASVRFGFKPSTSTTLKLQFGNNVTGVGITSTLAAGSFCRLSLGN